MSAVLQMLNDPGGDDSSGDSSASSGNIAAGTTTTLVYGDLVPTSGTGAPTESVITLPVSEVQLTPDQLSQLEAALTSEEGQKILETFVDPAAFIPPEILEPSAICIPAQELDNISLQHTVAISTAASTDPKLQSPPMRTATPIDDSNPEAGYYGFFDHSYCSTALDQLEEEVQDGSNEKTAAEDDNQKFTVCNLVVVVEAGMNVRRNGGRRDSETCPIQLCRLNRTCDWTCMRANMLM